jgi:hypothetical protein
MDPASLYWLERGPTGASSQQTAMIRHNYTSFEVTEERCFKSTLITPPPPHVVMETYLASLMVHH